MTITPITLVLLVFAVTISAVEDSILFGLLPFILAFVNEGLRVWALQPDEPQDPFDSEEPL